MTNNLRNWIHFVEVRDDSHAQKEVVLIAKEIKEQLKEQFPNIAKALNWQYEKSYKIPRRKQNRIQTNRRHFNRDRWQNL